MEVMIDKSEAVGYLVMMFAQMGMPHEATIEYARLYARALRMRRARARAIFERVWPQMIVSPVKARDAAAATGAAPGASESAPERPPEALPSATA